MRTLLIVCQVAAALGLMNVWLLRFNAATPYRGGDSHSMLGEFASYGLPNWFAYLIGSLKIGAALALIAGIWYPVLVRPAAVMILVLMLGALAMHFKIRDPVKKYAPAAAMLALSVVMLLATGER